MIEIIVKAFKPWAFVMLTSVFCSNTLYAALLQFGEADLDPSVRISYISTSNAFRSSTSPQESTGILVSPAAKIIAEKRGLKLELGYFGGFGSFSVGELNYDDHELYFNANAVLGARKRVNLSAFIRQGHDNLGEGATRGVAGLGDEQVKHVTVGVEGRYRYGAETARLNVTGGFILETIDYQNRSDIFGGRDFSEITPYGVVSYRLSGDTRATAEIKVRNINSDTELYDRVEFQGLLGIAFRATEKSGGFLKAGVSDASYADSRVADRSFLSVSGQLYVIPTSFSRFELNLTRKLNDFEQIDVDSGAQQSIIDLASLRWTHNWSAFVSTVALFELTNNNRDCPEVGSTSNTVQVDLVYGVLNWMEIGVGLSQTNRSDDECANEEVGRGLDYDRQDARIFVNLSL